MPRKTQRAPLLSSNAQLDKLTKISNSLKQPAREVQRAKILLKYYACENITHIHRTLNISKKAIYKCIDKALAMGPEAGLKDKYHRPFEPVITKEAKTWVTNLACTKPKDHDYAAELWTLSQLAKHTRKHAPPVGYDCLKKATKTTIHRILKEQTLQPHKIKYYLERRDPDFEKK